MLKSFRGFGGIPGVGKNKAFTMADTQRTIDFGNTDPLWREFLQAVGDTTTPRRKQTHARDQAIQAIREQREANQQRLKRDRP